MVYDLRKRPPKPDPQGESESSREAKRQKATFLHWRDREKNRPPDSGRGAALRQFEMFQAQVRDRGPPQEDPVRRVQGQEVFSVHDLQPGSGNFLKIRSPDFQNMYFLVRRKSDTQASALQINECEFEI